MILRKICVPAGRGIGIPVWLRIVRSSLKLIVRQIRRQTFSENFLSLRRLIGGESIRYFWRRARFARAKQSGQPFILGTRREVFLLSTRDSPISPQIFAEGEFDFFKLERALSVLGRRRMTTLLDIGAHVGSISIPAVKRDFADRAIAVEPDAENFHLLRCNILMNGLSEKITAVNAAAGSATGSEYREVDGGRNTGDHRFVPFAPIQGIEPSATSPSVRLDAYLDRVSAETSLLWMDIQGAEGIALEGAGKLLAGGIPVVLELDPKMLEGNGGLDRGFGLLQGYASFVDVNSSSRVCHDLSFLESFYSRASEAGSSHDLLFIPSHDSA